MDEWMGEQKNQIQEYIQNNALVIVAITGQLL